MRRILFFSLVAIGILGNGSPDVPPAFILKWGSGGTGPGQFNHPNGIAVDLSGNVYVADTYNGRVQVFSSTGVFISMFGSSGSAQGQFRRARDVAIGKNGKVYVTDEMNDRVQVFSESGTFLFLWGSSGNGPGQFYEPFGIALDDSDNVYVSEDRGGRVQKFTSDGQFITMWGSAGSGDGQFTGPKDIAVDHAGNVFVADADGRIQKFTRSGAFLSSWRPHDEHLGLPYFIAADDNGDIYVTDSENGGNRVIKFTGDGKYLTQWGSYGTGDGQFIGPSGVFVDAQSRIYVSEPNDGIPLSPPTGRIQVFAYLPTPVDASTWGHIKTQYR